MGLQLIRHTLGAQGGRGRMGHLRRSLLFGTLLVGVAVIAASCGNQPAATGQYLATISGFTLAKGHPGYVTVDVRARENLRLYIMARRPLTSCRLAKVDASDGSAIPIEPVALEGGPDAQPSGFTTYELRTTKPVTPGTYRVELVGNARVEYMKVDNLGSE
jgi:hypothetical protein